MQYVVSVVISVSTNSHHKQSSCRCCPDYAYLCAMRFFGITEKFFFFFWWPEYPMREVHIYGY